MHAIRNARVRLFATALSTLGIGAIISGLVVPEVKGAAPAASGSGDCDDLRLMDVVPLVGIGPSLFGWLALWFTPPGSGRISSMVRARG